MRQLFRNKLKEIGLICEHGFPKDAYSITDGILSLQFEKNGGINELTCISILKEGKTFYPDWKPIPIFSKNWCLEQHKYQMYGPSLRFISTTRSGKVVYHCPDELCILPFGFVSSSKRLGITTGYNVCIKNKTVVFTLRNLAPDRDRLNLLLVKSSLVRGEIKGVWKKVAPIFVGDGGHNEWNLFKTSDPEYQNTRKASLYWNEWKLHKGGNCFYATGNIKFHYGKESICLLFSASSPVNILQDEEDFVVISMPWESEEMQIYLLVEESLKNCLDLLKEMKQNPAGIWASQIQHYKNMAGRLPRIEVENHPSTQEMARTIPLFLNAMKVNETGKDVVTRCASAGYGCSLGWDNYYMGNALLMGGEYDFVKKILNYSLNYSIAPTAGDPMAISLLGEYYWISNDLQFVRKCYPLVREAFLSYLPLCDKNGMMPTVTYQADDPAQLQHAESTYTPEGVALLYNGCRFMENLAMLMNDEETELKSRNISRRIESSYLESFYDKKAGYLIASIDAKTGKKNKSYPLAATGGLRELYGCLLVEERIDEIASFIKNQLYHPFSRTSVPYWDKANEMWKSCVMQQHVGQQGRIFRMVKDAEEILRLWKLYQKFFEEDRLISETINLCGLPGDDIFQHSKWQGFAASSQYEFMLWAIAGIDLGCHGITYYPADLNLETKISNLRSGNSKWDIEIEGRGKWVEKISIDGTRIHGSLKTFASHSKQRKTHFLRIQRGKTLPKGPLILDVIGAGIEIMISKRQRLVAEIQGAGRISVSFFSPIRPVSLKFNGKEISFKWNSIKNIGLAECIVRCKGQMDIVL